MKKKKNNIPDVFTYIQHSLFIYIEKEEISEEAKSGLILPV